MSYKNLFIKDWKNIENKLVRTIPYKGTSDIFKENYFFIFLKSKYKQFSPLLIILHDSSLASSLSSLEKLPKVYSWECWERRDVQSKFIF